MNILFNYVKLTFACQENIKASLCCCMVTLSLYEELCAKKNIAVPAMMAAGKEGIINN